MFSEEEKRAGKILLLIIEVILTVDICTYLITSKHLTYYLF